MKFDIKINESDYPGQGRSLFRKWKKKALTPLAERFWAKIDKRGPNECWPWLAGKDGAGYGRFQVFGEPWSRIASRLAWELEHGPIPEGKDILHSCDNPACVNPRHLRPGTHAENMQESASRGRMGSPGEASKKNKLTQAQVEAIRRTFDAKSSNTQEIARTHGVSDSCIVDVLKGRTWKCSKVPLPQDTPELQRQRHRLNVKRGVGCSLSKLSEADVLKARRLYSIGIKTSVIATQLGVTPNTINLIIRRATWKHI